jgi:hypothetical protein
MRVVIGGYILVIRTKKKITPLNRKFSKASTRAGIAPRMVARAVEVTETTRLFIKYLIPASRKNICLYAPRVGVKKKRGGMANNRPVGLMDVRNR